MGTKQAEVPPLRDVTAMRATYQRQAARIISSSGSCLRSTYTGYEDVPGSRNSHDRSFPVSIGYGSQVFVCDNMAFLAEHQIKRRHTVNPEA
jgi:hypothetical protein